MAYESDQLAQDTPGNPVPFGLDVIFNAVASRLQENRESFNLADTVNGNHGNHMVEVFFLAAQAAGDVGAGDLSQAMERASHILQNCPNNDSARLYALGLAQFSLQFRKYGITLADLLAYVRWQLGENPGSAAPAQPKKSGDLTKALLAGLTGWRQIDDGKAESSGQFSLDSLFELGLIYLRAKERGGTREEIIAETAVNASPLKKTPYRYQSGKLALKTILEVMANELDFH